MSTLTPSNREINRARVRTLSADHVFFDADGKAHIIGAGNNVLELDCRYTKVMGRLCVRTRALAFFGFGIAQVWTLGKLVAWERA